MQLAAWQTARGRSYRAILAPSRIFIKTFAAVGWSTPDWVGGSGSSGLAAASSRPGTNFTSRAALTALEIRKFGAKRGARSRISSW
eukprot:5056865-Pyramimonas_sp.AAC.1